MTTEFLWNSSRIWSEFSSKIRWLRNFYEILQGFWSEFWWPALVSNNSDDYWILQELDDHGILVKFFQDLIRILVASQFRWLLNSSRVRWPQNSYEILQGFWSEFWNWWLWNSYIWFQGFWSEFWWPPLVTSQIWIDTIVDYVSNKIEV